MFDWIHKRFGHTRTPTIDELTQIDNRRKKEANRIIRSMGKNSIVFPLTGRSYTPQLDKEYNELIQKRLIEFMDLTHTDEVNMSIAPDIVGSSRRDFEHAFFNHVFKKTYNGIRRVYDPLVDGFEMRVWMGGAAIVRTKSVI